MPCTSPSVSFANNTTAQRNQIQTSTTLKQENQEIELDFALNNANLIQSQAEETLYWSRSHKGLSHPELFTRAEKTRARLIPDLKNTLIKLSGSTTRRIRNKGKLIYDLEPPERRFDLRLTGRVSANDAPRILMTGWVWIQCSDLYSVQKVKKRLAELQWLESNAYAPVHVYRETIVAAEASPESSAEIYDYRSGVDLGSELKLHVDVALTGESDPLCGRLCRGRVTHKSKVVYESFCRIGGIIRVNGSMDVMTTTAHGLLKYFIEALMPLFSDLEDTEHGRRDSSESSSESSESDWGSIPSQEEQDEIDSYIQDFNKIGYIDVSQIQNWAPSKLLNTATYVAQAQQLDKGTAFELIMRSFDADYALLEPPTNWNVPLNNVYRNDSHHPDSQSDGTLIEADSLVGDEEKLRLLIGTQETILVELSEDEIEISMLGTSFKTRKLLTPGLLARGTSGSWVVRGKKLCGVILAICESEPYALMMPTSEVFRDIKDFGNGIQDVSLPPTRYEFPDHNFNSIESMREAPPEFDDLRKPSLETSSSANLRTDLIPPSSSAIEDSTEGDDLETSKSSLNVAASEQNSGSRRLARREAARLRERRLALFIEEPSEGPGDVLERLFDAFPQLKTSSDESMLRYYRQRKLERQRRGPSSILDVVLSRY